MSTNIPRPKNPEDDWKVWLVMNPSTWLFPILLTVLLIALAVHATVFSIAPKALPFIG